MDMEMFSFEEHGDERGVPSNLISVGKSLSKIRREMEEEL